MHRPLPEMLEQLARERDDAWFRRDIGALSAQDRLIQRWVRKHGLKTVQKVCVCVWRERPAGLEVLAFSHPSAGLQLVKGTREPGEDLMHCLRRELAEEAGLERSDAAAYIGLLHQGAQGGLESGGLFEHQLWHLFALPARGDEAEQWSHVATGSPDEEGLVFEFFWHPLRDSAAGFTPVFTRVMALLVDHLQAC